MAYVTLSCSFVASFSIVIHTVKLEKTHDFTGFHPTRITSLEKEDCESECNDQTHSHRACVDFSQRPELTVQVMVLQAAAPFVEGNISRNKRMKEEREAAMEEC